MAIDLKFQTRCFWNPINFFFQVIFIKVYSACYPGLELILVLTWVGVTSLTPYKSRDIETSTSMSFNDMGLTIEWQICIIFKVITVFNLQLTDPPCYVGPNAPVFSSPAQRRNHSSSTHVSLHCLHCRWIGLLLTPLEAPPPTWEWRATHTLHVPNFSHKLSEKWDLSDGQWYQTLEYA